MSFRIVKLEERRDHCNHSELALGKSQNLSKTMIAVWVTQILFQSVFLSIATKAFCRCMPSLGRLPTCRVLLCLWDFSGLNFSNWLPLFVLHVELGRHYFSNDHNSCTGRRARKWGSNECLRVILPRHNRNQTYSLNNSREFFLQFKDEKGTLFELPKENKEEALGETIDRDCFKIVTLIPRGWDTCIIASGRCQNILPK